MTNFIHKLHNLLLIVAKYSVIFTVVFFLPVPLSHFLSGSVLSQTQHSPLFEYFTHYNISTDSVLENTYTNVYIGENKDEVRKWDEDNAILWADALAYRLEQENIPVIKRVVAQQKQKSKTKKSSKNDKSDTQTNIRDSDSLLPKQVTQTLINVSQQFQSLLPFISLTQEARQWIILGLNSDPKLIKNEFKKLVDQNPEDNFLIITKTPINLGKKSIKMDLPQFDFQQAQKILTQGLKVTEKQAQILLKKNKNSLLQLAKDNNEYQQLTIKSLLGDNYHEFDGINQKEQEILRKLCSDGKLKLGKVKMDLTEFGVIVKNKYYQWANQQSELNYQLQKETQCGKEENAENVLRMGQNVNQKSTKSKNQENSQKITQSVSNNQTGNSSKQQLEPQIQNSENQIKQNKDENEKEQL